MARDYIKVDIYQSASRPAVNAAKLVAYRDALRDAYEKGKEVLGVMNHNFTSSPLNFADIEALFGIPAGRGQEVFNLVNGSIGAMEGTMQNANAKDLTEILG